MSAWLGKLCANANWLEAIVVIITIPMRSLMAISLRDYVVFA